MFSVVSVSHSFCPGPMWPLAMMHWTSPYRDPFLQYLPWPQLPHMFKLVQLWMVGKRAVCILLECFHVLGHDFAPLRIGILNPVFESTRRSLVIYLYFIQRCSRKKSKNQFQCNRVSFALIQSSFWRIASPLLKSYTMLKCWVHRSFIQKLSLRAH